MSSGNVLGALSDTNTAITLGLEIAGQLIPLGKGLLRSIKAIGTGSETQSYVLLITADAAELDAIAALSLEDLAAVNAELTKLGKAPVIPIDSGSSATPPIVESPAAPAAQVPDPAAGAVTEVPAGVDSAAPLEFRGTHWSPPADPAAADVPATDAPSSAPEVKAS